MKARLVTIAGCTLAAGCTSPRSAGLPPPIGAPSTNVDADAPPPATWPAKTYYRTASVDGHHIFYREAGDPARPTILLLHGFPSSSHTYRELIPLLSGSFHVVAPDYLGAGRSDHPSPKEAPYTFDLLARYVTAFVEAAGFPRYVLYMQDFGGPVGLRVAMAHPERLRGLIVQNANAYLDGLTPPRRAFFLRARDDHSAEEVAALNSFVSDQAIETKQYLRDVPAERAARMAPDSWTDDEANMPTPADRAIQVQLFQDYQNSIDAYPVWQQFLRTHPLPALILWGERDPAFVTAGALAYRRDLPNARIRLLDAGHFAVEELAVPIAQEIVRFMSALEPAALAQRAAPRE